MNSQAPAPAPGDDRDWTFVVTDGCDECGFRPFDAAETARRISAGTERWRAVLERPDAAQRPSEQVWSPLEYACHVRDMVRLLGERVKAIRDQEAPEFADWDGDAMAVKLAYWAADPGTTWEDLGRTTRRTVSVLESVPAGARDRTGRRSDGVEFTVASLGQYIGHEMEHHLHDVRG
ncbi:MULTISPECIES: DinB family protein [Citricoccus]|uniref:DinB family protein n=1 Tax=Citricoccus TaxID=169133 RepID=UPI000255F4AE|nr:DinB family protein [Citricoccus sp. CH26A]